MEKYPESSDNILKKWKGIPQAQLEALETRQRQRIAELEDVLQRERQELDSLIAAKSGGSSGFG